MRLLLIPGIVAVVGLVSGCFDFDDGSSPNVRPAPVLSVVNLAPSGGPCSLTSTTAEEIATATATDCVALDARATVDENGDSLSFGFSQMVDTNSFLLLGDGDTGILLLTASFLATLPTGEALVFHVLARDEYGAHDSAIDTLVMQP